MEELQEIINETGLKEIVIRESKIYYNVESDQVYYSSDEQPDDVIELDKYPDLSIEKWDETQNKFVIDNKKALEIKLAKIKSEQSTAIETATFEHDGKKFSCGLIAQSNYIGLKTAIDSGIATYPAKCWSTTGEEFVIKNEETLKTLIGKLFSVVYPIREKANKDEQEARK